MNTNNGVKWRRIILPKKVEQINADLFIDTYKSDKIKVGVSDMTVNGSKICVRCKNEAWSIPEISGLKQPRCIQTKEERKSERDRFSTS